MSDATEFARNLLALVIALMIAAALNGLTYLWMQFYLTTVIGLAAAFPYRRPVIRKDKK